MADDAFSCRMCGHCCQGQGGILLTDKDLLRLAAHLGLEPAEVLARYAETRDGKVGVKCGPDGCCVFYKDGCGVHPGRPDVCRAWPFFRGNLVDESSWRLIQDYCPGVNPDVPFADFVRQGRRYLQENELEREDQGSAPNALLKVDGGNET